jgi:uncharacterized protein YcbX
VAVVGALHLVPVKGMAALPVDRVDVGPHGFTGDRAFSVVDGQGGLHTGRRQGALLGVRPEVSADGAGLALALPSGEVVRGPVVLGPRREAVSYDRRFTGRRVEGPFGPALAALIGRPAELIRHDPGLPGWDEEAVSLVTTASLDELAAHLDRDAVDPRRFRMGIEVGGAPGPRAEDGWVGGEVAVGGAVLEVVARCERCVVTTRRPGGPEPGAVDLPVLRGLAGLRGRDDVCLGVLCRVVRPGPVAVGDPVSASGRGRGASGAA